MTCTVRITADVNLHVNYLIYYSNCLLAIYSYKNTKIVIDYIGFYDKIMITIVIFVTKCFFICTFVV